MLALKNFALSAEPLHFVAKLLPKINFISIKSRKPYFVIYFFIIPGTLNMKTKLTIISFICIAFFLTVNISAQDKTPAKAKTSKAKVENTKTTAVKKAVAFNKVCPVMGDEVDCKVKTVEYNGKVYRFCCKNCIKKFNKDPEKYSKTLNADGTKTVKN